MRYFHNTWRLGTRTGLFAGGGRVRRDLDDSDDSDDSDSDEGAGFAGGDVDINRRCSVRFVQWRYDHQPGACLALQRQCQRDGGGRSSRSGQSNQRGERHSLARSHCRRSIAESDHHCKRPADRQACRLHRLHSDRAYLRNCPGCQDKGIRYAGQDDAARQQAELQCVEHRASHCVLQ